MRFEAALQFICQFFTSVTIEFLNLGDQYFRISSKTLSSIPSSNLAQMQYGIEGRRWSADPFFAPWLQALQRIIDIEAELESETLFASTASGICEHINEARAIVGNVVSTMQRLGEGMEQIKGRERTQKLGRMVRKFTQPRAIKEEESGLDEAEKEARRLRRKERVNQAKRDEERRELPRQAFEQAMFENWQRRNEGFERMELDIEDR